jgi:MoaA/NifB/PqqE/SkfB family radical SAM enzyme
MNFTDMISKVRDYHKGELFFQAVNFVKFKLFNTLGIEFKPSMEMSFPPEILIESTNFCNLKCIICPQKDSSRKRGYVDFELYKKLVDEVAKIDKKVFVRPFHFGEPLLNTQLPDMIKYAKDRGIQKVGITTNGLLLNERKSRELINAGLDEIEISFEGVNKQEYEQLRINSNYEEVARNIKRLATLKKEYGTRKPHVKLSMVKVSQTEEEIKNFKKYWNSIVDTISIRKLHNWVDKIPLGSEKMNTSFPCRQLWVRMYVLWNGDITFCCMDHEGTEVMGNAKRDSLLDVWQGEKFRKFRELHLKGRQHEISLCSKCTTYWRWDTP